MLTLYLTLLILMQNYSKVLSKIKKRIFLTCRLLRQGHPLNLLPANLQYWGLHSQRAVYIVHCRHFSFLQLPFVLPNKTHIWCIIHGTVSLKTTERRQQAIQLRKCQVYSHWEPGPSSYYIQIGKWYSKTTKYVVILKGLRPEVLLILSWLSLNENHFVVPSHRILMTLWNQVKSSDTTKCSTLNHTIWYSNAVTLQATRKQGDNWPVAEKYRRDKTWEKKTTKGRRTIYGKERKKAVKGKRFEKKNSSLFCLISIWFINIFAVFLAFETAIFLAILFNCALTVMYLFQQVLISDKKNLWLQLLQGNVSSKYPYASQQLEE